MNPLRYASTIKKALFNARLLEENAKNIYNKTVCYGIILDRGVKFKPKTKRYKLIKTIKDKK